MSHIVKATELKLFAKFHDDWSKQSVSSATFAKLCKLAGVPCLNVPEFPSRFLTIYYINPSVFFYYYFALYIVLDVAALQFVGCSMSVLLNFNILFCTIYLCLTWQHCSCWTLNIGAFCNNELWTIFICVLRLQHSHLHTPSLSTLPTILAETWEPFQLGIPYHTWNATQVARETTVFLFCFVFFFLAKLSRLSLTAEFYFTKTRI